MWVGEGELYFLVPTWSERQLPSELLLRPLLTAYLRSGAAFPVGTGRHPNFGGGTALGHHHRPGRLAVISGVL